MELRVLGPFEVDRGEGPIGLGGRRQRTLLAVLAVHHPEAVSSARLIDALWGESPPATAAKTVQVFVARLRRALGAGVIVTSPGGYALGLEAGAIDSRRFEAMLAAGRERLRHDRPEEARRILSDALGLWRGPPFADLSGESAVQAEARRLDELRAAVLEARVEADLALGRHADVLPELEGLVAEYPLHEGLRAQLMLALYRCGRQAEALSVFQAARQTLLDELGLEPGPALQVAQAGILAHDPALAPPPATHDASPPLRRRPGWPWAVAACAAAVGGVVAIVAALSGGESPGRDDVPVVAGALAVIDPASGRIVERIPVGAAPVAVAVGAGGVWVASAGEQTLERVDPVRRTVNGRVGLGRIPSAVAVGEHAVWVASAIGERGIVARVEPGSASIASTVTTRGPVLEDDFAPPTPNALAVGDGALWVNRERERLVRRPTGTGAPRTLRLPEHDAADGLALGAGALWVASSASDRVLRIDPRRARIVGVIPIAARRGARVAGPYGVAAGGRAVWVTDALADAVSRVDPRLGAVTATIPIGRRPTRIAVGEGAVWVLNATDQTLTRIDPRTNTVTATVPVPGATDVAAGAGHVWVAMTAAKAPAGGHTQPRPLRPVAASGCSRARPAAGDADVLVVSDLPTWIGPRRAPFVRDARRAIRAVLGAHGYRAGRYRIAYQQCDDSTRAAGTFVPERCAANARAYAADPAVVGVIGPYNSGCSMIALPILNAAPGGPVAVVSPTNTYVGLSRAGPATAADEPDRFYPTHLRNYARTIMADDGQGAALALLARQLGVRHLYLLDDAHGTGYGVARSAAATARRLGIGIAGTASWRQSGGGNGLARKVRRSGADGVLLAGCFCTGGFQALQALRRVLPSRTRFIASDAMMAGWETFPRQPQATEGMYVTGAGRPAESANHAGRLLLAAIGSHRPPESFEPAVLEAAVATEVMVDAIARSDGSRGSVVNALRTTHRHGGVAGELSFDRLGDPRAGVVGVYRFRRGAPIRREREIWGLVYDRVIEVRRAQLPHGP
jgi:DNA-binding SARP family transcriptional activator/ABC-type branched-subunit amino acid transport system substrate-binding protein/DNA-binding beta-propeller fold protein YncE